MKKLSKPKRLIEFGIAVFCADLLSGLFHIFMDNLKCYDTTSSLQKIAFDFQEHHKDPRSFCRNRSIFAPGGQGQITRFVLVLQYLIRNIKNNDFQYFINAFFLFSSNSQVIHSLAHRRYADDNNITELSMWKLPIGIKFLQNIALLLSPDHHSQHHKNGTNDYGIVNGWANPLLNLLYNKYIDKILRNKPKYFNSDELSVLSK